MPAAQPPLDTPPPVPAALNARGGFSLSRQLGLGIARIVIDAGHGGHDPGASVKGLTEADLTLDIALRLEKLLLRQPGVEVVQTRRTNAYVPLEERTEIANRSGADLFLSIHANASTDRRARGVETYFLNFAPNAEAEAIAARENAGSTRPMRQLPELRARHRAQQQARRVARPRADRAAVALRAGAEVGQDARAISA